MIACLTGKATHKDVNKIVLELDGIGYEILVPKHVAGKIKIGEIATVHTHEYLREDARELYGFLTRDELGFFRRLIHVPGVGPKTALLVLDLGTLDQTKRAILAGQADYIAAAPGVGKKTAQKIILELKGTLEHGERGGSDEVVDALTGLGYTRAEAHATASQTSGETDERLKAALKILGRKR